MFWENNENFMDTFVYILVKVFVHVSDIWTVFRDSQINVHG